MATAPSSGPALDARLDSARRLLAEGITAMDAGQLSDAVAVLRRALAAAGQDRERPSPAAPPDASTGALTARILLSLAFVSHEQGDTTTAAEAYADAERLAETGGHREIEVLIHGQRGAMYLREGQPAPALAALDEALELIEYADQVDQFKILVNRSEVHGLLGDLSAAKADCRRAIALAQESGRADLAFFATHNLGLYEFLSGHLPTALATMPTPDQADSDFSRGVVGMDRAKVLLSAGLVSEADQSLQEASRALARTELVQFLAEAELTRAQVALLAERPAQALALSRQALTRLEARTNTRALALAELTLLRAQSAVVTGAGSAAETAGDLVDQADALAGRLTKLGLPDQAQLARLIGCAVAGPEAPRRPPPVSAGQPIEVRLLNRLVRARRAYAAGRTSQGRRQARLGMSELAEHQAQFGSLDLQTSGAAHGVTVAAAAIRAEIAANRPTAVLSWLEQARAISGRVPQVAPPRDAVTADLLGQLRWVAYQLDADPEGGPGRSQLQQRRAELQRAIRHRSWNAPGQGAYASVPTVAELRAELGAASLVAYFALGDTLYGLLLTRRRCRVTELGSAAAVRERHRRIAADLDVLAMDLVPAPLRQSARNALRRGLAALAEQLLAPLDLPAGPVVVVPPGPLAGVAWGLLPGLRGRPVTVAPSAAAWLRAARQPTAPQGPVVFVAGPGLARAEEEVEAIHARWPAGRRLAGAAATGEAVLAAIDGARLVHIAAHGQHEPESPLFSAIRLADGPLVGYDLDRLRQAPRQVVLSACELGRATVRAGDEALGMTRALLHAGTATVIAGVARVSDAGSFVAMTDYHRRLAAGAAPAYALAEALAQAEDPLPFVCFGAGW